MARRISKKVLLLIEESPDGKITIDESQFTVNDKGYLVIDTEACSTNMKKAIKLAKLIMQLSDETRQEIITVRQEIAERGWAA
jgi:predicted RNA-binding protein YlxR (DUF448 family)